MFPVTQGPFGIALHVLNPFRDPFEDIVSGFHRRLENLRAEAGHANLLRNHKDRQQKQVEKLRKDWKCVDCSTKHAKVQFNLVKIPDIGFSTVKNTSSGLTLTRLPDCFGCLVNVSFHQ